jgi:hypothetical protein
MTMTVILLMANVKLRLILLKTKLLFRSLSPECISHAWELVMGIGQAFRYILQYGGLSGPTRLNKSSN